MKCCPGAHKCQYGLIQSLPIPYFSCISGGHIRELLLVMTYGNSPKLMNSAPIMSVKTDKGLYPKPTKATMAPVGGLESMCLNAVSVLGRQSKLFEGRLDKE